MAYGTMMKSALCAAMMAAVLPVALAQSSARDGMSSRESMSGQTDSNSREGMSSRAGMSGQANTTENSNANSSAGSGPASEGAQGNSGQSGSNGADAGSGSQAKGKSTVSYILIPIEMVDRDISLKNGCWVKIFSNQNYTGDTLTLSGAVSMPDMTGPFGINWSDRVRSIEVGKNATVTFYDNENFRDKNKQFAAGQKVPNVSKQLGFFDDFRSMKMTCSK